MTDPVGLSRARWAALAAAREALADAEAEMKARGTGPEALVTGGTPPRPYRHYPAGDLYDADSHAQAYFHNHGEARGGHFHLFIRTGPDNAPSHLGAVSLSCDGRVTELFTTNRWVTGESWLPAPQLSPLLKQFRLEQAGLLGRWLTAVVGVFRPLFETLLEDRDAAIARWSLDHPQSDPLEDEGLEVTSRIDVSDGLWLDRVARMP